MDAIIRSGARRLAGSALLQQAPAAAGALLQRAPAASCVDAHALRRPFLARLMSSTTQTQHMGEIQAQKEELYDLLSVTENSIHTDTRNLRLLRYLSAQIKPRPDDPQWRFTLGAKRRSDVIRPFGIVSGLALGFASTLLLFSLEDISVAILKEREEEKAAANKAARKKAARKKAAREEAAALP